MINTRQPAKQVKESPMENKILFARTANGKDIYSEYEIAAYMRVHAEVDLRNILEAIKKNR